ncbi:hypothetical protein IJJ12_01545 [bacterium]|nr:hypothetical protein [bacterium]
MRKTAFTLVELLTVITLMTLVFTIGTVNYIRQQDRQQVEGIGRNLVAFFHHIQTNARTGDRGTGSCNVNLNDLVAGKKRLARWSLIIKNGTDIYAYAYCCNEDSKFGGYVYASNCAPSNGSSSRPTEAELFTNFIGRALPDGVKIYSNRTGHAYPFDGHIFFSPEFGDMEVHKLDGTDNAAANATMVVYNTNTKQGYRFDVDRGVVSSGCLCPEKENLAYCLDPSQFNCP